MNDFSERLQRKIEDSSSPSLGSVRNIAGSLTEVQERLNATNDRVSELREAMSLQAGVVTEINTWKAMTQGDRDKLDRVADDMSAFRNSANLKAEELTRSAINTVNSQQSEFHGQLVQIEHAQQTIQSQMQQIDSTQHALERLAEDLRQENRKRHAEPTSTSVKSRLAPSVGQIQKLEEKMETRVVECEVKGEMLEARVRYCERREDQLQARVSGIEETSEATSAVLTRHRSGPWL